MPNMKIWNLLIIRQRVAEAAPKVRYLELWANNTSHPIIDVWRIIVEDCVMVAMRSRGQSILQDFLSLDGWWDYIHFKWNQNSVKFLEIYSWFGLSFVTPLIAFFN